MRIKTQARYRLLRSGESGFTMIVTLVVLFVSSLLMAAAFAAANGDIHLTANDTAAKRAYYAAQAGISNYAFHLDKDFNYWTYCTGGAAASNTALNLVGETPLKTRAVPGVTDEKYAIQLLPASTAPVADKKCDPVNPVGTMIENHAVNGGTFRIQSTGYSGSEKRTILATFAHTSFLNFLYYTQYETLDPNTYTPPEPACEAYATAPRPPQCTSIQFVSADVINGPMHTEDRASICGEPTFGRGPEDTIEFLRGSEAGGGCSNKAIYKGTLIPPAEAKSFEPPPTNAALKSIAGTKYEGKTVILLTGETMTVTEHKGAGAPTEKTTVGVPFPANGVIYVTNKACAKTYTPYNPSYTTDTECGNVYVSGKYTSSLTIGAENDIVINSNLEPPVDAKGEPTTNAVLGLVANNFVRVYHPLSGARGSTFGECGTSANGPGFMPNPAIYAAILAVNHSFIVDNFDCGVPMEKLNVHGAIAQIFRGTVGTHNGNTVTSGYAKNYLYDNRLEVESPPYFLNPIAASWSVKRAVLTPSP